VIAILAVALFLEQDGCTPNKPATPSQPIQEHVSRRECSADHRFTNVDVPLAKGDVALDTCTGQLCKTWDWVSTVKSMQNGYQQLPLCSTLAEQPQP